MLVEVIACTFADAEVARDAGADRVELCLAIEVGGHHTNFKLGGGGDNLVLTAASGTGTLDIVTFNSQTKDVSQGRFPDGAGSLAFFAGTASPSQSNWLQAPVVINEVLSNSSGAFTDAIEIFNPSAGAVNIGGWWLSDDRSAPRKFQIAAGTTIAAGGYAVFYESLTKFGIIHVLHYPLNNVFIAVVIRLAFDFFQNLDIIIVACVCNFACGESFFDGTIRFVAVRTRAAETTLTRQCEQFSKIM